MASLEEEVNSLLHRHELTVGTVESASGGFIAHLLTNVPGSSSHYKGSIVAYRNEIKVGIVGVRQQTLDEFGAVSSRVAEEMAEGGRKVLGVDICISDTGIAGPGGGTGEKPSGLFYFGLSHKGGTYNRRHDFKGDRLQNKLSAAQAALGWLREYLAGLPPPDAPDFV